MASGVAVRRLITTPIFYVNAAPHLGHLSSALIADAHARWLRLNGHEVVFSTGTDEHGLKVLQAAEKQGLEPHEFCTRNSAAFRQLFDATHISYTDYIRTTEPRHAAAVSEFWKELQRRDYIYLGQHEGWYSVSDETFVPESQITVQADGTRVRI